MKPSQESLQENMENLRTHFLQGEMYLRCSCKRDLLTRTTTITITSLCILSSFLQHRDHAVLHPGLWLYQQHTIMTPIQT